MQIFGPILCPIDFDSIENKGGALAVPFGGKQ